MKVLLAVVRKYHDLCFCPAHLAELATFAEVLPAPVPDEVTREFLLAHLGQADAIVTSWGTPALDAELLAAAPRLRFLAHAAGSVKPVTSDALWARGIRVSSAAAAIGTGVAEFCLGLMLTAPKRAFWGGVRCREGGWRDGIEQFHGPHEIYRQTVGIVGAGYVGKQLIALLQPFRCQVLVYDPYLTAEQATALGVTRAATLDELFSRSMVVSVNAPATAETREMIRGRHLALLPAGALLINTARASILHTAELIAELRRGRIVACLDVTDVEPPPAEDELRRLPNVWLTPHEAGAVNENLLRIGDLVVGELRAAHEGRPLRYEVRQEQLARIA
jgi:phosphoglycerate dehydrogenase-like enzyme